MSEHERHDPSRTTAIRLIDATPAESARRALFLVTAPTLALGTASVVDIDAPLQVGRAADLALADSALSRCHFAISPAGPGAHHLRDLASRNGTFVGGRRIRDVALRPGDVIRAGDTLWVYGHRPRSGSPLLPSMKGVSAALHQACARIRETAPTLASVLIEGETGTGKELVARALHELSERRGPLVALNVATLPEPLFEGELFGAARGAYTGAASPKQGLFASADRGSFLLDEIGELPSTMQAKLLRVVEERAVRPLGSVQAQLVDVRILAATNVPLQQAIERGAFRMDLYARLAEVRIGLPPLRERPEDILPLARHFLEERGLSPLPRLSGDFAEALLLHDWRMNARELRSVLLGIDLASAELEPGAPWTLALLPDNVGTRVRQRSTGQAQPDAPLGPSGDPKEAELRTLLLRHEGRINEVAAALQRDRKQIYRWMERYGLRPEDFRTGSK